MSIRLLPCLLLMALLLLPLFAQLSGYPRVNPLEEYRTLAEWPEQSEYFGHGRSDFLGYTRKLNAWHLDNFATRAFWVRLRTQALYTLFRESDQVYIGPDGWLFYRSVIDVETPGIERITADDRHALVAKLARLTDLLQQRGITLYVAPLALKHRYYPELLPTAASHAERFTFYDDFMDDLVTHGSIHLLDSRRPLEQAKREGMQIFHRTDFHWTDPTAALIVRPLLEEIANSEGLSDLVEGWRFDVVTTEQSGGQARALPLLRTPTEPFESISLLSPLTRFDYHVGTTGIEWSGEALPDQGPLLKPILTFGDSFLDAWSRAGFFNFFESFATARIYNIGLVEAYQLRQPGTRTLLMAWITSATFAIDQEVSLLIAALEAESAETGGRQLDP